MKATTPGMRALLQPLTASLTDACRGQYADRLVSVVLFGSAGRGTTNPDSDIDLLIVADPLPDGRVARVQEFTAVERRLAGELRAPRLRLTPRRLGLCDRDQRAQRIVDSRCVMEHLGDVPVKEYDVGSLAILVEVLAPDGVTEIVLRKHVVIVPGLGSWTHSVFSLRTWPHAR